MNGLFGACYAVGCFDKVDLERRVPVIEARMDGAFVAVELVAARRRHELRVIVYWCLVESLVFEKVWSQTVPSPAWVPHRLPPIKIFPRSTDIHEVVDCTASSEDFAAWHGVDLVAGIGLWSAGHAPVVLLASNL